MTSQFPDLIVTREEATLFVASASLSPLAVLEALSLLG